MPSPGGRGREPTVGEDELVDSQLLAQPRLAELGRQELEERHVRRDRREVRRDRDRDARLPGVRHDQAAPLARHVADAARLGEAPDPADVGLRRRAPPSARSAGGTRGATRATRRRRSAPASAAVSSRIAVDVVGPERRLEEEDVVARRSARRRAAPARPSRTRTGRRPSASCPGRRPRAPRARPRRSTRPGPTRPLCAYGP